MPLSSELVALLRCPVSRAPLVLDGERLVSTDEATRRAYPVRDEIPDLYVESGTELPSEEWRQVMERHRGDPA